MAVDERREFWARTIRLASAEPSRDGRIWVVEDAQCVLGCATTRAGRDDDLMPQAGEVQSIYVAPEAWSRGLGSALLATAAEDLRTRAYWPLVPWVIEANARGQAILRAGRVAGRRVASADRFRWRPGRRDPVSPG